MNGIGRCDDANDDGIASSTVGQAAIINGIGKMETIPPVTMQLALTSSDQPNQAETSTLSRI